MLATKSTYTLCVPLNLYNWGNTNIPRIKKIAAFIAPSSIFNSLNYHDHFFYFFVNTPILRQNILTQEPNQPQTQAYLLASKKARRIRRAFAISYALALAARSRRPATE